MQKWVWIPLLWMMCGCGLSAFIQRDGIAEVSIGSKMPAQGLSQWQGYPSRDTLFEEGGFQWRGVILEADSGKILLESDFDEQTYVNRIRVESAGLETPKKLQVGLTVADLKKKWIRWRLFYFPQYGLIDVSAKGQPTIHYLVRDAGLSPDVLTAPDLTLSQLSEDATIVAIVVM